MSVTPRFLSGFCATSLDVISAADALGKIATCGYQLDLVEQSWLAAVVDREKEFPTGLPTPIPVAIPHTDSKYVKASGIGYFRLAQPVTFGEMGSTDSTVEVSIIIPLLITDPKAQVDLLMSVVTAVQDIDFMKKLMDSDNPEEIENLLNSRLQSGS
ncbi:MAG: PTS sugar transporter subunit IIA [Actinobacteria bacterium]|nr:PTS sugar transporter subunit IIA [Actinomycetota bacterium]